MVELVEHPSFKSSDFDPSRKKPGISAIVRLRDEEDYLQLALESIEPFFDECVIVYNQCTDRTPEIAAEFESRHPQRVRAFHYVPVVFPPASEQHRELPPDHVSSFVHYSNFALSKASYRIYLKWDGDMIAAPEQLGRVVERLRGIRSTTLSWLWSPWKMGYWWFAGVNLWDKGGEIYVPASRPTAGTRKDVGFWPAGRRHIYRHYSRGEYLRTWWLKRTFVGYVFFHVKGMKRERGADAYRLEHATPAFRKRIERIWTAPELMTLEEYRGANAEISSLPDPESLGIRPVRG